MTMENQERRISWTEYLALEAVTAEDDRLEYSYGTVLAAGEPSQDHETIVANLTLLLGPAIRAHGCRFWMKQHLRRLGQFSHDPDFLVSCAASDLGPGEHRKRGIIEQPSLVVEILSPATRAFDLDDKVTNYATFDSLLQYVVIDTTRRRITQFYRERGDDEFRVQPVRESLVCKPFLPARGMTLSAIYDGTFVPQISPVMERP